MSARFCTRCGAELLPAAAFCAKCGAPVAGAGAAPRTRAGAPAPAATPTRAPMGSLVQAAGVARQAAGYGSTAVAAAGALSLPWQTFHTGGAPDVRALVAAGAPLAQRAAASSLRRPAIALLVTTVLDLGVALLVGQSTSFAALAPRIVLGIATAALGMVSGSKSGTLRTVTGIASSVTGVLQLLAVAGTLGAGGFSPLRVLMLLPALVSQLSMLAMLTKTTWEVFGAPRNASP